MRTTAISSATARHAQTTTRRDSRRRRSHAPTVNTVSASAAAFSGPMTDSGSKTPKPSAAYSAGVSGGHSGGYAPEADMNPCPAKAFRAIAM